MPDRHFTFTVTGSMEDRDDVALLRRIATPQAEPGVPLEKIQAAMAPAPGPRYTIDEVELKRRLHRPAQPGYNFGKPYDLPPTSGTGMEIRKALASETFKRELATVVAVRLEHPGQRILGSLLDLLTFAVNEGLI